MRPFLRLCRRRRTADAGPKQSFVKRHGKIAAGSGLIEIVNGYFCPTPAAKPGDDLLFHSLSWSTIGAVRFHGRVRDGIGWVTDAMVTKLWDRRIVVLEIVHFVGTPSKYYFDGNPLGVSS